MSEIKKLKVKAKTANSKKLAKLLVSTKDAMGLVKEIEKLEEQEKASRAQVDKMRVAIETLSERLLHLENDTPKILNITGGKFN